MPNAYIFLAVAIIAEVTATSALKASLGFTRLWPTLLVIVGYGIAFYLLSHVMKTIPVGMAYAIWSGAGIVLVTLVAVVLYGQMPDLAAIIGIALILAGIVILNVFSDFGAH